MSDLWDDPYGTVVREYRHGPWQMPQTRQEWNDLVSHKNWHICEGCGYKWSQDDFSYALNPVEYPGRKPTCWNCHNLDLDPNFCQKKPAQEQDKPSRGMKRAGAM